MPRFFDELDAIPEPGPVPVGNGSLTDEQPVCWNCRETVERPGWHIVPDTQEYSCVPRTQPPVNMKPVASGPPVTYTGYPPAGFTGWVF